jgi:hypothetical protein
MSTRPRSLRRAVPGSPLRRAPRGRERGSAYIIALLVLLVLSMVGLSLVAVTETEMQLGGNERALERTFYGSESGIGLSISRVLTVNQSTDQTTITSTEPMGFVLPERLEPIGLNLATRVEVSPYVPLLAAPCNWCPTNYDETGFFKVNHAVVSQAERVAWSGPSPVPPPDARLLSQKRIYLMAEMQPWWEPDWRAIADEEALAEVQQQ